MPGTPLLVECDRLDPRAAAEAAERPFRACVNIPLHELPRRVHELPSRHVPLHVVGEPNATAPAVSWLVARGHAVVAVGPEPQTDEPEDVIRRLWRPNAFLARVAEDLRGRLEPGRPATALELACGAGRDAVHLASRGWLVTAIDHLPDALERASDLERRYRVGTLPVRWLRADLEAFELPLRGRFDLIVGIRYLHRDLMRRLPRWLRPGGALVWETFTREHRRVHGKPADDAHVLAVGELPSLFEAGCVREFAEEWRHGAHVARIRVERPGG